MVVRARRCVQERHRHDEVVPRERQAQAQDPPATEVNADRPAMVAGESEGEHREAEHGQEVYREALRPKHPEAGKTSVEGCQEADTVGPFDLNGVQEQVQPDVARRERRRRGRALCEGRERPGSRRGSWPRSPARCRRGAAYMDRQAVHRPRGQDLEPHMCEGWALPLLDAVTS